MPLHPILPVGCTRNFRRFERVHIVTPAAHRSTVLNYLLSDTSGWRITYMGPYTDKDLFPRVDETRFIFDAEREIEMPT